MMMFNRNGHLDHERKAVRKAGERQGNIDIVPSLSAQNLQCIKIGKDFMLSHGYIKNDFDVDKWAAPGFLERGVREWLEEEWERKSWSKLAEGGGLETEGVRLG